MSTSMTSSTSRLSAWLEPHPKLDGVALIDHLFNRLDGLYPNRWRAAFANQQAIENWRIAWAEGLAEEGITFSEIKRGLVECRRRFDWPPSFAEFLKACRPAPDYEVAFIEAVEQMRLREQGLDRWSSPAIYWAAARIGNWDLRSSSYQAIAKRWQAELDVALEEQRAGRLPEIPPARPTLPAPGKTTTTTAQARAWIAACQAILEGRPRPEIEALKATAMRASAAAGGTA